jgi:Tfp pilus assembly protein PilO
MEWRMNMNMLRAHLMHALSRAGWAGAVGAALLAFVAALQFGAVAPLQEELGTLESERDTLAERVSQGVTVVSPREQVDRFDATLVAHARIPAVLAELSEGARRNALSLARVESRESQPLGAGYGRQEYVFPLRGSYPSLRAWLAEISKVSPSVVIEDVIMRREDISRGEVEVTVRLAILTRDAS